MKLLLLTGLACVALVALVELGARAWIRFRRAYYVCLPGQRLRLQVDRDTLPELDPLVRFDVNRDGERGPELPRLRRGETLYRVLVAGGSQPEGYLLDQDVNWPGALQMMLSTPEYAGSLNASRVHVGSIGRSGVGAEALDLILERVLPRYRRPLSAIVILVGASDVLRWLEEGAPQAPSARAPIEELFRCHPEGPFGWTPRTFAMTQLARLVHRRICKPERVHPNAGRWLRKARAMRARAKVIRATMPDPEPMLAHFEHHFRRAIARAQAHAERVIVVRQSWYAKDTLTAEESAHMWHGGVGQAWREELTTYFSIEITGRLMALLDARAAQIAESIGVQQIDLMPVLEPNLGTYYDYFHLTPSGARSVAAIVARTLADRRQDAARNPARAGNGDVSPCADLRAS